MNHPTSEEEDICKQLEKRNKLYDKFAHLIVSRKYYWAAKIFFDLFFCIELYLLDTTNCVRF